jgi:hypothetical protein
MMLKNRQKMILLRLYDQITDDECGVFWAISSKPII